MHGSCERGLEGFRGFFLRGFPRIQRAFRGFRGFRGLVGFAGPAGL